VRLVPNEVAAAVDLRRSRRARTTRAA
jgi:hypothetical protein